MEGYVKKVEDRKKKPKEVIKEDEEEPEEKDIINSHASIESKMIKKVKRVKKGGKVVEEEITDDTSDLPITSTTYKTDEDGNKIKEIVRTTPKGETITEVISVPDDEYKTKTETKVIKGKDGSTTKVIKKVKRVVKKGGKVVEEEITDDTSDLPITSTTYKTDEDGNKIKEIIRTTPKGETITEVISVPDEETTITKGKDGSITKTSKSTFKKVKRVKKGGKVVEEEIDEDPSSSLIESTKFETDEKDKKSENNSKKNSRRRNNNRNNFNSRRWFPYNNYSCKRRWWINK